MKLGSFFSIPTKKEIDSITHPITLLSFAIQYALFGQNPSGYHLVNAILHSLNSILVFLLLLRLRQSPLLAFLTAVYFALHPLQVESVAWISSHKTLLSGFFSLLTLIAYASFLTTSKKRYYLASLIVYLMAVFSKPTAIVLPILLYFLQRGFVRSGRLRSLTVVSPFASFAALQFLLVFLGHTREHALAPLAGGSLWRHSVAPFWTLFAYLKKVFIPNDLLALYPCLKDVGWSNSDYWLPALIIIGAFLAMFFLRKRLPPTFSFFMIFYVVLLLPTMNLLPLSAPIANRYMYLPIVGPIAIAGMGVERLHQKSKNVLYRTAIWTCLTILSITLFFVSRCEIANWHDSETLWLSVLKKVPNHPLAHVKLGDYYYEKGDLDRAISLISKGVQLGLNNPFFAKNLIAIYIDKGDLKRARESALSFLKQTPNDERFYVQLGIIEKESDPVKAETYFRKATEINPQNSYAWYELGRFYLLKKGDIDKAYSCFLKSLEKNPYEANFHIAVADCFSRKGYYNQAIAALRYALTLDERSATAWLNLGGIFKIIGQNKVAEQAFDKASALDPKFSKQDKSAGGSK